MPIRSDLDRARQVAAVRCHRSLDLRHVTERRFLHLKETAMTAGRHRVVMKTVDRVRESGGR